MDNSRMIENAVSSLFNSHIDPTDGLPESLFLLISSLIPIPNVDLLIINNKNQILLSWRDDSYYGKGWHIPGGCLRFGETLVERVQKTALEEIGTYVEIKEPIVTVRDAILPLGLRIKNRNIRGHNVTVLYRCSLPKGFEIDNKEKSAEDRGFLRWFDYMPENRLPVCDIYRDVLKEYYKGNFVNDN